MANSDGVADVHIQDSHISLISGDKLDIKGRSLVVHEKRDDLGLGGDEESKYHAYVFYNALETKPLKPYYSRQKDR